MPLFKARNSKVIRKGFPENIQKPVDDVLRKYVKQHESYPIGTDEFSLETGENVLVPARIHTGAYNNKVTDRIERLVYDCIYSRSTDGYIREAALKDLYGIRSLPAWVMPYLYQSLSDYVLEISSIIDPDEHTITSLQKISVLNPEQFRLTRERAISYWNAYYRWSFSREEYPALKIIDMIHP